MSIQYLEELRTFRLDSEHSSYVLCVAEGGVLMHLYYGGRVSDDDLRYLRSDLAHASFSAVSKSAKCTLDTLPQELPCNGTGDMRLSALQLRGQGGHGSTDMRYEGYRIYAGKPCIPGLPATYANNTEEAQTLEILMSDSVTGARAQLFYTVFPSCDAIARHVRITNGGSAPLEVERVYSACLDLPSMEYDMVHLYGTWAGERSIARLPLEVGTRSVQSKRGSSSHQHNPFAALVSHDATEESGDAYGVSFVYSGNFSIDVECDAFGNTRLIAGLNPTDFGWHLEPDETFCSPEAVLVYSGEGLGGMSRRFHRLFRYNLCRGHWKTRERPIIINNWEATYFDFDSDKLVSIACEAAGLGIEMLVMDDGWFGGRTDDTTSLGDWFVNEERLGCSLPVLAERVRAQGVKFGIWFEPEAVSPKSGLYVAHPDWCLQVPGRERSEGRHELLLDMSRGDVRDYLFERMSAILRSAKIDYVKWDFNRNLTEVGSTLLPAERQKELFHRYVLGVYELLERLLAAFPELLIEGCSGGGGRFDPGMLYYAPQIWTSDNTDAVERLGIQLGTSLVYPASSMSAHVSACPNHQTGRSVPFRTRGHVALAGVFGYELDLTKLTKEEKELVAHQVATCHRDFDTIQNGDLYRLILPFGQSRAAAWMYVSRDRKKAIVTFVTKLSQKAVPQNTILRLCGLDPDAVYIESESGRRYHGDTLMNAGLNLTAPCGDFSSRMIHLEAE